MPLNTGNVPSYLILETEAEPRRVFWGPKGKKVARACCPLDFQFQREGPGLCMRLGNVWGEGRGMILLRPQSWGFMEGRMEGDGGRQTQSWPWKGKNSLYLGD